MARHGIGGWVRALHDAGVAPSSTAATRHSLAPPTLTILPNLAPYALAKASSSGSGLREPSPPASVEGPYGEPPAQRERQQGGVQANERRAAWRAAAGCERDERKSAALRTL